MLLHELGDDVLAERAWPLEGRLDDLAHGGEVRDEVLRLDLDLVVLAPAGGEPRPGALVVGLALVEAGEERKLRRVGRDRG